MTTEQALASAAARALAQKIESRDVVVGVMGLGYVGLPLATVFCENGIKVIGFDIDDSKVSMINEGQSYLSTVPADSIQKCLFDKRLEASSDPSIVEQVDVIIICVPTPLNKYREPDLSFVENTVKMTLPHLRPGKMIALESTTYPGTTDEIIRPLVESAGLRTGSEVFLVYSPEREDPGNTRFNTATTPKVVGGENADALALGSLLYGKVVEQVVPVSSLATAEAVKLTENIFRAVNISLVNELKVTLEKMDINIWEVIDAAKTKPFGYMPFYPGPGLGGHCIPIDPFYLTWKAREFGISTRFIELAGEINNSMPEYVISRLRTALDERLCKGVKGSTILLVGLAYKKNVSDTRESPALLILRKLLEAGADVEYYDPFVPHVPATREYQDLKGIPSLTEEALVSKTFDAALICTDHDCIDYEALLEACSVIVDTRNATRALTIARDKIVLA